jgi:ribosome-binding factor A
MSAHKDEKLAEAIRELASKFVNEESNRQSLITVTRVVVEDKGKKAIVFFTTLPQDKEVQVLDFLSRKAGELRHLITESRIVGFAPRVEFAVDSGEHNRQRIDELLNEG